MISFEDHFDRKTGPLVRVRIHLSEARLRELRKLHRPIPQPVDVLALIDTGADCSCINREIYRRLSPPGHGMEFDLIQSPAFGGLQITTALDVSWIVYNPARDHLPFLNFRGLPVIAFDLPAIGYEALIGRDILSHCQFHYDGRKGRFILST